jgi:hypothetical protein
VGGGRNAKSFTMAEKLDDCFKNCNTLKYNVYDTEFYEADWSYIQQTQ